MKKLVLRSCLSALLFTCIQPTEAQITNGLVAFYPFDGKTDDASGYGRNATAVNGASYEAHFAGMAIQLSGSSQYVALPGSIPNDQDLTVALWIKTSASTPSSFPWDYFIASRDIAYLNWDWNICIGQGRKVEFHTGTDYTDAFVLATPDDIPSNEWVHIACVADSKAASKSIYINGQLAATTSWTPHPFANNGVITYLGNATAGTDMHPYLAAGYDEVRFYDRALSAEEVLAIFNNVPCVPHRAIAVASVADGAVVGATITDPGCGYTNVPSLQILGGGGSGATGYAQTDGETVTNIVITTGGSGYTEPPTIIMDAPAASLVPPFILRQPEEESAFTGAPATFTVFAGGLSPLSYQWLFGGSPIDGATESALVLTNLTPTQSGVYSVVITNEVGSITSSNATLTVNLAPAAIRVVSASGQGGQPVTVPITIAANGNENALAFSLSFNPTLLSYSGATVGSGATGAALLVNASQADMGRVGFALGLDPGSTLAAGTEEVVLVTFDAAVLTSSAVTPMSFTDLPLARQLADTDGHLLPASYSNGSLSLAPSEFEADLSPRPAGNRIVDISDWVVAGRYAARLDYPTNASEFRRADCAPRGTLGDGAITVIDWVQAGRYAAKLDPITVAGGPDSEGGALKRVPVQTKSMRTLRAADALLIESQAGAVSVLLEAQGDENAVSFSVSFDTGLLTFQSATLGKAAAGAQMIVNSQQAAAGKVGILLGMPIGTCFPAGSCEVVKLNFRSADAATGNCSMALTDQPVPRGLSDSSAGALSASYVNGTVSIMAPPKLSITNAGPGPGRTISVSWPGWGSNFTLQSAPTLSGPAAVWTNVPVTIIPSNAVQSVTLPANEVEQYYRLIQEP